MSAVLERSARGLTATSPTSDCAAVMFVSSKSRSAALPQPIDTHQHNRYFYICKLYICKSISPVIPASEFIHGPPQPKSPACHLLDCAGLHPANVCRPFHVFGHTP